MPERLARAYWIRLQRILRRIARGHSTTHEIALGAAIGIFIGMTPTIGLQMVIAAAIATLLGANRLSAILPVWISNPATMVWLYGSTYTIGRAIVGGPTLREFLGEFKKVHQSEGLFAAMQEMFNVGMSIQLPLWLGSILAGTVCAVPTYFLVQRAVDAFRDRLSRRREARNVRVTKVLRKRAEDESAAAKAAAGDAPTDPPQADASSEHSATANNTADS